MKGHKDLGSVGLQLRDWIMCHCQLPGWQTQQWRVSYKDLDTSEMKAGAFILE